MTDIPNTPPSPDGTEPFPTVTPDRTPELTSGTPTAAVPPPYQPPAEGALPPPYQPPAEGALPSPYQAPADSPFTPVEAPTSSGGLFGRPIVRAILAAVIAVTVGVGVQMYSKRNDPEKAVAGDCIQKDGDSDAKKVDCSSPDAQFKVLSKVTNVKRSAATDEICWNQPATHSLWQGQSDKDDAIGFALCLEQILK